MALTITHATVASDPQAPLLDHNDWNASHVIAGTVDTSQLGTGTANSGAFLRGDQTWDDILVSQQAVAFGVTRSLATGYALSVNTNNGSSFNGLQVTAGSGCTLGVTGGGNSSMTVQSSGTGLVSLSTTNVGAGSARLTTANGHVVECRPQGFQHNMAASGTGTSRFVSNGAADSGLGGEVHLADFNHAQTRTHTGVGAEQRDFRIRNGTRTSASALTLPKASTFSVDGAPIAAGSMTITEAYAIEAKTGRSFFGDGIVLKDSVVTTDKYLIDVQSGVLTATLI